jgi:ABC-type antimicrobial peptide transport system permease subunit
MQEIVADSTARARFTLTLLSVFAAIALLLASVGIYGLVSYSVEQRTREIGIRVAIGATPANVRNLVLGEGLRLALFGIAAGTIAAGWLTRFLEGMIYGVKSWDPAVFAGAAALLASIAVAAAFIPALRATRVDPLVALRND